ncbi:MAG TPA: glycosyltransferase family 2 protein [Bacteroidia bacterium]|nr:glycosyltransferase family 2 protein [Bacteroidia bacterium]
MLSFWGVWLFLILVAAFRVFGFPAARRRQDHLWKAGDRAQKPVALILAVKGFEPQATPRFFDAIFDQGYRDYRVIVGFESWDDPVAQWLCEHLELGPDRRVWTHPDPENGLRSVTLVAAGLAESEGQKVHNQRAAFGELTVRDSIVAFADADILCDRTWLTRLVAPINCGTHELATTYRWLVPKRPTLPNQLASVINASIATQGGSEATNVLWGGSMALTRPLFNELDVPRLFEGSLNDDLRLSKAARATGRRIAFVRSLILPTPVDFTWRSFFEFVRRQYTQVKFFSPILYTGVNLVLGFYVLGALSIVAALVYGYFFAWIPVAAAYVIDQFRALARQQVYLSLFPESGIRQKLFAASWLEHMLTPFWLSLHWLLLACTWTQDRITWAGVRYRILSKSKTEILGRKDVTPPLPAGMPGLAMIGALHDRRRSGITQSVALSRLAGEIAALGENDTAPEIEVAAPPVTVETETVPEIQSPAAAIPSPPLAALEIAPAIRPLSTVLRRRTAAHRPEALRRGTLTAAEARTRKTRLLPTSIEARPLPPAPVPAAPAPELPQTTVAAVSLPTDTFRPLSNAQKAIRRPRASAPSHLFPSTAPPEPPKSPRTTVSQPATRTRIKAAPLHPVAMPPSAPSLAPSAAAAPSISANTVFFPTHSLAARRANVGSPLRNGAAPRRSPALSARPAPAGQTAYRFARPVSRGPSSRP